MVVSLLPKAFKEGERELRRVERLCRELGYGFFDLDSVHVRGVRLSFFLGSTLRRYLSLIQ